MIVYPNATQVPVRNWVTSSHSTGQNQCVQVAALKNGRGVAVRDSKNPNGPAFVLDKAGWAALLTAAKTRDTQD